jgi:hypothetical protein
MEWNTSDKRDVEIALSIVLMGRQASGPSSSLMGGYLLYDPLPPLTQEQQALATTSGLRGLANLRRASAQRERAAAESAHNGAWGDAADEMEAKFLALERESLAWAEHYERLAQRVEAEGVPA